jgi:hypothetical protein
MHIINTGFKLDPDTMGVWASGICGSSYLFSNLLVCFADTFIEMIKKASCRAPGSRIMIVAAHWAYNQLL